MTLTHDPQSLRLAVIALLAATADTPAGARLCRRMLAAAVDAEPPNGSAEAIHSQRAVRRAALMGLARTFRTGGAQLRARPDVTTIADAFELAGDHLEALVDAPLTGPAPA